MSERFERLYRAHVAAVLRFARSCAGRREIAEDITSDVFLALYRNLDRLDDEQLEGWLITVARNRARDYWRHDMAEHRFLETVHQRAAVDPVEPGPSLFDSPVLKSVHRVCLHLRYVEGMTRTEIAAATGLSQTQVKGHLEYALHLLREDASGGKRQ